MAFPGNGTRYVIGGTLAGGERFSFGFYGAAIDAGTTMQAVADGVVVNSLFTAFIAQAKVALNTASAYTTVTTYRYGSGRAAIDTGSAAIASGTGTGASIHPNQTAMCVTLRTALANRRGRGRVFLPANGASMSVAPLFNSALVTPIINAIGPWMDDLNAEVWSTAGTLKTRVRVADADYVPDTMNSRRDRLTSARSRWVFVTPD